MGFALVTANCGNGQKSLLAGVGTFSIPITVGISAGNLAILPVGQFSTSTVNVVSSITDTKGNVWHVDITKAVSGSGTISICSSVLATPLTTSDNLAVVLSSTGGSYAWQLSSFSGSASSPLDLVAIGSGTSNTLATGTTGTLAQPTELVF